MVVLVDLQVLRPSKRRYYCARVTRLTSNMRLMTSSINECQYLNQGLLFLFVDDAREMYSHVSLNSLSLIVWYPCCPFKLTLSPLCIPSHNKFRNLLKTYSKPLWVVWYNEKRHYTIPLSTKLSREGDE